MSEEELEKTINEIFIVLDDLGSVNFYTLDNSKKSYYQKNLNSAYDRLYRLKKHLEFILHVGGNYEKYKEQEVEW